MSAPNPRPVAERTHGRTEHYVVPVDAEAEARLVGAALAHETAYEAALAEGVQATDFGVSRYGQAWHQLERLYAVGAQVAAPLVAAPLLSSHPPRKDYPGIAEELAKLQASADVPMARRHAATVLAYAERRRMMVTSIALAHRIELADADTEGHQILVEATTQLAESLSAQRNAVRSIGQVYDEVMAELVDPKPPSATGFPMLDDAWAGGLYPKRLYAIAARMKKGKTSFLFTAATQAAQQGAKVAYIALEMGATDLLRRHINRHTALSARDLLTGSNAQLQPGDVARVVADHAKEWVDVPFHFYDRRGLTGDGLRGLLARLGSTGFDGVVIDYWQLVRGFSQDRISRAEELTQIACTMAEMAVTHNMWILTAAQLNRDDKLRDSDGLLMSCDWLAYLQESELEPGQLYPGYYLEVRASRYTSNADIGGPKAPCMELVGNRGPHFRPVSYTAPATVQDQPNAHSHHWWDDY